MLFSDTELDLLNSCFERVKGAGNLGARERAELLQHVREYERQGYDLAAASGTLELIVREVVNPGARPFEVVSFEVTTSMQEGAKEALSSGSVVVEVNGQMYSGSSASRGPIEALDRALRSCLAPIYPDVEAVKLTDYRLHVLDPQQGTASVARVSVDWTAAHGSWTTMGVSENMIEASWLGLSSAVRLELMRAAEENPAIYHFEDNSWAV
jgi:2-isopropylmalate synthase